jgi:hypothetical protein
MGTMTDQPATTILPGHAAADEAHRARVLSGIADVIETVTSAPMAAPAIRRWVREFWADQMRAKNAPDLPDDVTVEDFETESERLADRIAPRKA